MSAAADIAEKRLNDRFEGSGFAPLKEGGDAVFHGSGLGLDYRQPGFYFAGEDNKFSLAWPSFIGGVRVIPRDGLIDSMPDGTELYASIKVTTEWDSVPLPFDGYGAPPPARSYKFKTGVFTLSDAVLERVAPGGVPPAPFVTALSYILNDGDGLDTFGRPWVGAVEKFTRKLGEVVAGQFLHASKGNLFIFRATLANDPFLTAFP